MARGALLALLVLIVTAPASRAQQKAVTGIFESCPACRLNAMPELKRFFYESVLEKEYPGLAVKFIPGAVPTLILYDGDGKELSREEVSDKLTFDELHKWVQGKGFAKGAGPAPTGAAPAKEAAPAASSGGGAAAAAATTATAAAAGADKAAAAASSQVVEGPPPRPKSLPERTPHEGQRRRRRRVRGGGVGGGGGGRPQGAMRRRRRRRAVADDDDDM